LRKRSYFNARAKSSPAASRGQRATFRRIQGAPRLYGPLMASDTLATKFSGGIDIMKLKPLNDRVLVKRLESEEKTAGGLYIPDTAKEKPSKGLVVAAGPGKLADDGSRIAMAVKNGDEVLFNKYAGTEVKLDGVEHLVMREEDILAIID
jgi:chaperonin GroES